MIRAARGLLTLEVMLVAAACGGAAGPPRPYSAPEPATAGRPLSRSNLITFDEMQRRGQHSNLYSLVQDLRPRWLRSQGPDSFIGRQGQVQVRIDGNRLGGVETLRRLSAYGVTSIEWVAPIEAAALFGLDYSHGAIIISTRPVH